MAFSWREGKRAAMSFSFDDARVSQLNAGIPLLNNYRVRATFYVSMPAFKKRLNDWQKAIASGHEIGNHTYNHPCSGNFLWSRQTALENYTLAQMQDELCQASQQIKRLLGVTPTTFAYPCGQTFVGRGRHTQSYVPLVAEMFSSGRGYQGEAANDPTFCDMAQLLAVPSDNVTFAQLEPFLTQIGETGGWLILAGHDIGEDGTQTTSTTLLEKLINEANRLDIWLDTVGAIADYIIKGRVLPRNQVPSKELGS